MPVAGSTRKGRIAFSATVTAAGAIVAGWVIRAMALPALRREFEDFGAELPTLTIWALECGEWLPWLGVPALLVAFFAIANPANRAVLGVVAFVLSLAAVVAIIGTLVGSMLPLYQMHTTVG
jgi:type II secretory pathway component PulF